MTREEEVAQKTKQVHAFLDKENLDGLLLTKRANFAWLTAGGNNHVVAGSEVGAASLLITQKGKFLLTDNIESPRLQAEEMEGLDFEVLTAPWHEGGRVAAVRKKAAGLRLGSDIAQDEARVMDGKIAKLRFSLLEPEIHRYRQLGRDCAVAMTETCKKLRPGLTEFEVAGDVSARLLAAAIIPQVVLVAADERIRLFRHPIPTNKKIEKCCMVVICGYRGGLILSMTRIVHFGPLSDDLKRRHQAVVEVDAATIAATRPGSTAGQVFSVLKQAYAKAGFPEEWQHHHQGGATGYASREWKATREDDPTPILANQAFAWNPSIAGTKSEDTIIALPAGPELLSPTPDLPAITVQTAAGPMQRADILVQR